MSKWVEKLPNGDTVEWDFDQIAVNACTVRDVVIKAIEDDWNNLREALDASPDRIMSVSWYSRIDLPPGLILAIAEEEGLQPVGGKRGVAR